MTLRRIGFVAAVLATVTALAEPPAAQAATPVLSTHVNRPSSAQLAAALRVRGGRVVAVARAQKGKPYRFGARGPSAFDCSGLTGFVYRQVHVTLPRTADAQYRASVHILPAAARPGDLVFWLLGGHAYHVAVYAGAGSVWHAPRTGETVQLTRIWDGAAVRFGRVR